MKKLLITALTFISILSFSQDKDEKQSQSQQITSREVEIIEKSKIVIYRTEVKIDVENLTAEADSVFFNEKNKTMMLFGASNVMFSGGETIIRPSAKSPTTIQYKLNDKIMYVE